MKGDVLEARRQRRGCPGADHCLEVLRVVQGGKMKLEQVQATTVSFEQIIFVLLEEYSSCRADNRLGLGVGRAVRIPLFDTAVLKEGIVLDPLVSLSILIVLQLLSGRIVHMFSVCYSEAQVVTEIFSQVRASRTEGYSSPRFYKLRTSYK